MTAPTRPSPTTPIGPPPSGLAVAFHTVLGNLVFAFATVLCGFLGTVTGFLPPRGDWMFRSSQLWGWLVLRGAGVKVEATFETPLDPRQGYVFLANHQSMLDIPALLISLPGQARFLAKRSLFFIPFFGWGLWAGGFIPVDRRNRKAAQNTFRAAERTLRRGKSILIFPEETRSYDGQLLPFKRGGMLLAQRTGFPIVPVGIEGAFAVKPRGSWVNRPGVIRARYGRPIDPESFQLQNQNALIDKVRDEIARLAGLEAGPAATTDTP